MLDEHFCDLLEDEISIAFVNSANVDIRNFWCDGVYLPLFENFYLEKFVNYNRSVTIKAFAGLLGQDQYKVILFFGPRSLSKYARGLAISNCLPDEININLLDIDVTNRRIQILLD